MKVSFRGTLKRKHLTTREHSTCTRSLLIVLIFLPPVSITAPSSLVAKAPDAESTLRRENKYFPLKFYTVARRKMLDINIMNYTK